MKKNGPTESTIVRKTRKQKRPSPTVTLTLYYRVRLAWLRKYLQVSIRPLQVGLALQVVAALQVLADVLTERK
jgi:hypothetical protein